MLEPEGGLLELTANTVACNFSRGLFYNNSRWSGNILGELLSHTMGISPQQDSVASASSLAEAVQRRQAKEKSIGG